jgi:hypothetical protein
MPTTSCRTHSCAGPSTASRWTRRARFSPRRWSGSAWTGSAQARRVDYVRLSLPEPLLATDRGPAEAAELTASLSMAFLVLLEELAPAERAGPAPHRRTQAPLRRQPAARTAVGQPVPMKAWPGWRGRATLTFPNKLQLCRKSNATVSGAILER